MTDLPRRKCLAISWQELKKERKKMKQKTCTDKIFVIPSSTKQKSRTTPSCLQPFGSTAVLLLILRPVAFRPLLTNEFGFIEFIEFCVYSA